MSRITRLKVWMGVGLLLALSLSLAACGGEESSGAAGGGGQASGELAIEGSSTVQPITQAVAEAYKQENPDVRTSVGGAGTGDGFEVFCKGETQISDASRPIEAEEQDACKQNGVDYIEVAVAFDGITFVVNNQGNDWAQDITSEELKKTWEPGSKVSAWNQVRSDWPGNPLGPPELFGPGSESGTFDYFAETIADPDAEEPALRTNYQASENDNQLVQGVAGNPNALGFFGYSYYENNQDTLRALALDDVDPTTETIQSGEYPLSRPLFFYVSSQALEENKAVEPFVDFYLGDLDKFVEQAQYVTLPSSLEQASMQHWEDRTTGTVFDENGEPKGGDLEAAFKQSQ